MNNVQTNLMNIAPAPSMATKANAADAVKPVNQTGTTADRGAKNPSFDKALAKVRAVAKDAAETSEPLGNDPLAASLAASQQATKEQAASPSAENTVADENAAVAEIAPLKTAATETPAVMQVVSATIEDVTVPAEETVQLVEPQIGMVDAEEVQTIPKVSESTSTVPQVQPQANAVQLNNLDALLTPGEKAGAKDLLQALAGKNLLQVSQPEQRMEPLTAEPATRLDSADVLLSAQPTETSAQVQSNPMANAEEEAVLPDALLRMLASAPTEQPLLSAEVKATGVLPQAVAAPHLAATQAAPLTAESDTKVVPLQAPLAPHEEMAQDSSEGGFSELFNQQANQEQKPQSDALVSNPTAIQPLEEGEARGKTAASATFTPQTPQTSESSREVNALHQANPAVSFQTTLDETASAQPTAAAAPQKDYEVARQIVEQARLLRMPEQTEMVIRLKPEHLGELTLKVSVAASGAVNAAFHTDNATVRAIIETSMIQLKHELQAQGLKVDNVGVYAGLSDSSLMNGQQDANAYYAQQSGQGSHQGRDAQQALASFEEEQQALAAAESGQGTLAQDGVDYRI